MLEQVKIGLIGYGHLGKELHRRLGSKGIDIETNADLAERSDLLLLTVPPSAMHEVLNQIRGRVRESTRVISFAAAYPQHDGMARAMTDIEGFGGMLYGGDALTTEFMSHVSEFPTLHAEREEQIDDYTIGEACLPGVAAWQFDHDGRAWLDQYATFLSQEKGLDERVTRAIIESVDRQGSWAKKVTEVATGKGITAAMVSRLQEGERAPERIYQAGEQRMKELIRELTK